MNQETRKRLKRILVTLEEISVSGKRNLDMMLGCMQELEDILKEAPDAEQDQTGE